MENWNEYTTMKEYEKLAREFALETEEYKHSNRSFCIGDLINCYESGFLKAKEIALQIWRSNQHTYCDFYGIGEIQIGELGEREV